MDLVTLFVDMMIWRLMRDKGAIAANPEEAAFVARTTIAAVFD